MTDYHDHSDVLHNGNGSEAFTPAVRCIVGLCSEGDEGICPQTSDVCGRTGKLQRFIRCHS